jgi:hypothetical protein
MTKLDLSQIKPIPGFDSLKLKERVHADILRETDGMTDTEVRAYFREKSERFDTEMNRRRAAENQT